jgi:hypothetical protein
MITIVRGKEYRHKATQNLYRVVSTGLVKVGEAGAGEKWHGWLESVTYVSAMDPDAGQFTRDLFTFALKFEGVLS